MTPEEQKVTIRIEGDEIPEVTQGGGGPDLPAPVEIRKTMQPICWPCVLIGAGTLIVIVGWLWFELFPKSRG